MIVPLKARGRHIGIMQVGELRSTDRSQFTTAKRELADALAAQSALLIDRIQKLTVSKRRASLVEELEQASAHLDPRKEPAKLRIEALSLATDIFKGCQGALFEYNISSASCRLADIRTTADGGPIPPLLVPNDDSFVGKCVSTGQLVVQDTELPWQFARAVFGPECPTSMVAIPLKSPDVECVLVIASGAGNAFLSDLEFDLGILERFAARASSALFNARLITPEPRLYRDLHILHVITEYVHRAHDLRKIVRTFLTAVTANYGFGINRAALLLKAADGSLYGTGGVGEIEESKAKAGWAHYNTTVNDFAKFVVALDRGELPTTALGENISGLRIEPEDNSGAVFFKALRSRTHVQVSTDEIRHLPPRFLSLFKPTTPVHLIPLVARDRAVGVLIIDNKFTKLALTSHDEQLLFSFAANTAIAIENCLALDLAHNTQEEFRKIYEAGNRLLLSQDPRVVAESIVQEILTPQVRVVRA